MADGLEVVVAARGGRAPFRGGRCVGGDRGLGDRGVAVLGSRPDALEEAATRGLALPRWREEDRQPHQILRVIDRGEQWRGVRGELTHALAAARTCADEDQSPDELGSIDGDLLGDISAHREAEQIDVLEAESVDQRGGVPGHLGDGLRRGAGAQSDAGVVGEDHLTVGGEVIGDRRVVVVEVAHEVLQQHDRRADRVAEAPVGETDSVGVDELGRRGVVRVRLAVHGWLLDRSASAVGGDGGAGDVAGSWGCEEGDDLGDLLGL